MTFGIEIVRGYRPGSLEIVGAALTVGALAANNLLLRRRRAPVTWRIEPRAEPERQAA